MSENPAEDVPTLRETAAQFRRLAGLIRPYWGALLRGMVLGASIGVLGVVVPYISKLLIDVVYPARNVTLMQVLVGALLAIAATSVLLNSIQTYYAQYVNTRLNNATTLVLFNHLQHLPMRFFEAHQVGELMSRFSDVQRALQSVARVFQTLVTQGVYLVLVPPFLFLLEWKLALVAVVGVPITAAVVALTGRAFRRLWKRSTEAYAGVSALQVEVFHQMRTLKSLGLEGYVYRRVSAQTVGAIGVELRAGGLGQVIGTTNGMVHALNTAVFTWFGWTLILSGEMSLGTYIAFTAYIGYLYGPVNQLVGLFSEFQQSAVHLQRVFEYLDTPPEQDPAGAYAPPRPVEHRIRGRIDLEGVSFGYVRGQRVLDGVTLSFRPGTVTAVVGPSGSGKTSLLRLLNRTEDPEAGRILVDGTPIAEIPLADLRRQVAVVWQEYSLLRGTVWENLTLGLDDVDPEAVHRAARLARVDDFIHELPAGYRTPVAEAGASFSGGQRQRLALARALVRDAPVLLLDEATANVDLQTEARILQELFRALADRTVVFVTHRVAAAALADQVVVLEHGRVAGVGTHAELLLRCEAYRVLQGGGLGPEAVREEPQARERAG